MTRDDFEHELPDAAEANFCPSCMTRNPPHAKFCMRCGLGIGVVKTQRNAATSDSIDSPFIESSKLRALLVLAGGWLVLGPLLLLLLLYVILIVPLEMINPYQVNQTISSAAAWIILLGIPLSLIVWLLFAITRRCLRRLSADPRFCVVCGYNLAYLPKPRCPECGTPFDPGELSESESLSRDSENETEDDGESVIESIASDPPSRQVVTFTIAQVILAVFGFLILYPERWTELREAAILLSSLANIMLVIAGTALARQSDRDQRTPGFWISLYLQYAVLLLLTLPAMANFLFHVR